MVVVIYFDFFFFQAEDGIRDRTVTGVQTCALPISKIITISSTYDPVIVRARDRDDLRAPPGDLADGAGRDDRAQIGRASCRERVWISGGGGGGKEKSGSLAVARRAQQWTISIAASV